MSDPPTKQLLKKKIDYQDNGDPESLHLLVRRCRKMSIKYLDLLMCQSYKSRVLELSFSYLINIAFMSLIQLTGNSLYFLYILMIILIV